MFKNKMLAALAAFSLAVGALVGIAGPALADEESTNTDTPTVVEETVVSDAPAAEPVVEEAPLEEPAAEAPATEPPATEPPATEPPATDSTNTESTTEAPAADGTETTELAESAEEAPSDDSALAPLRLVDDSVEDEVILALAAPVTKVQFCHATASEDNPYNYLDTSVNAFFNAGHHTHQNFEDIVPPFSYLQQGVLIDFPGLNWDGDGQSIFANGCNEIVVVPGVATAAVFFNAATCTTAEELVLGTVTNASWGPVTDPPGDDDFSVTATADANNLFAGNLTQLTFEGELDPIDMSEDCDNTLVKKVQFCHATGSENNPYVFIDTSVNAFFNAGHDTHQNFEDIVPPFSYLKQGEIIEFPGLNWDAAGQAFLENGCLPASVLPTVTFTQFTCLADGSYALGVAGGLNPAVVTFTVNGTPDVLAGTYPASVGGTTVTAEAVAPNTLDPAWVDPPTFQFMKPSASDCVTGGLAVTGASVGMSGTLAVAGGLLFIGLVALFMRRRTTTG